MERNTIMSAKNTPERFEEKDHSRGRWGSLVSAACLSMAALGIGCTPTAIHIVPKVAVSSQSSGAEAKGPKVLLIADTHASNPYSQHDSWLAGIEADNIVKVAMRPAQLDAWGPRVLDWVLGQQKDAQMVIHLGDVANFGCSGEFERFLASMKNWSKPWFVAPGNHDMTFLGNYEYIHTFQYAVQPWATHQPRWWQEQCANGAGSVAMQKSKFIDLYLAAKGWTAAKEGVDYVPEKGGAIEKVRYAKTKNCKKYQFEGFLDCEFYEGYILQQVALDDGAVMILVDTTQLLERPRYKVHAAGNLGGMRANQLDALREWLEAEATNRNRPVILASHYPMHDLPEETLIPLWAMIEKHPIAAFLSAHTHDAAESRKHRFPHGNEEKQFLEVNVGSVLDWPMEYATLQTDAVADSTSRRRLAMKVHSIAKELDAQSCAKMTKWRLPRPQKSEPNNGYLMYKKFGFASQLREIFFELRKDFQDSDIRLAPPPVMSKKELDYPFIFSTGNPAHDALLAEYEQCQVRWASEVEGVHTHNLLGLGKTVKEPPELMTPERIRSENEADAARTWILETLSASGSAQ